MGRAEANNEAGVTREEILMVLKCVSLGSIPSCSLGAPILLAEAKAAGVKAAQHSKGEPTPFCDKMKAIGQWIAAFAVVTKTVEGQSQRYLPLWSKALISS